MAVNAHYGAFAFYLDEDAWLTNDLTTVATAFWQGNWACDYTPVTPAGSGDGTLYLPVIGNATWTVSFPMDETLTPDVLDLIEGNVLYEAIFVKGDSGTGDKVERTTLTTVQITNNNTGDAVRVTLAGMGGRVTEGVTA